MGSNDRSILYAVNDGVAWITLNRPERKNSLDSEAKVGLADVFARASASDDVRVVVLTGSGGSFSAGSDLTEVDDDGRHVMMKDQVPLAHPVESCPKPVIAAIDGPAIGGGFEMALASDIRVATTRSFFALTELQIGSLPGSGGTQRLFSAIPSAVAWRHLLTGDRLDAQRAHEVGLISDLFTEAEFGEGVRKIAASVSAAAPLSLRAAKLAARTAIEGGRAGFDLERALWAFLSTTEDRAEGRAAFREKRDPEYKGR
jgi:enoyl-CoA hydratase/carnithine racemase